MIRLDDNMEETKLFHIDDINGDYGEFEDYVTPHSASYFPVFLTKKQFELLKILKFNANISNNRHINHVVALSFIDTMEEIVRQINEIYSGKAGE